MNSGGPNRDVTVDLIAVETAELDGDDIVVERHLERDGPARRTTRRRGMAIAAAAVSIGAVGVGIMATRDGGDDVAAREAQTPRAAATTVGPTAAPTTAPTTRAADVAPPVPAPALPAPTAPAVTAPATELPVGLGAPASFEATIDPASAAVAAGTPVTVTLRVRNDGGETLHYEYDNDGCDPTLVASGDIVCTQAIRTLDVAPGTEASQAITIGTDGAQPNDYTVAIGDQLVQITII